MSKRGKRKQAERELARDLPWGLLLQGGVMLARRWASLPEKDRERVRRLLSESGGRLDRLSKKERKELRRMAGRIDLLSIGRELLPFARGLRARGGRRRGA